MGIAGCATKNWLREKQGMASAASIAKREEAVAKKFQSELFGQTSIDLKPQATPTAAEQHILGDFSLTDDSMNCDPLALLASIKIEAPSMREPLPQSPESLEWFSQLLERAADGQAKG